MKDSKHDRLREAGWRRKLAPAEEAELRAWLAQHPELSADWELEADLTEALARVPNPSVPSNFTARVLEQVEREGKVQDRAPSWRPLHIALRWLPRVALASTVVIAGLLSVQYAQNSRRQERADSVREIVSFTAIPGPEILQDYDAIQAMGQSPVADVELLKALQ